MQIFKILKIFFLDTNEKKFLLFVSKIFKRNKYNRENIIIVENIDNKIHHIPYIYFINSLVRRYKSKVFLYNPNQSFEIKKIIFNFFSKN